MKKTKKREKEQKVVVKKIYQEFQNMLLAVTKIFPSFKECFKN
jgi:hypothetical protein